jgi:hypothetical protein
LYSEDRKQHRPGAIAMRKRIVAILLVLLLSPSAGAADFGFAGMGRAAAPIDAQLGKVSVVPAGWPLEIYPLPPTLPSLLPSWRSALRSALLHAGIFRRGSAPAMTLSVKVMEFALTGNTLTVFARYQLESPGSAEPFFQTDIMTDAGVTSIDSGLPVLDYSARATQNRQQVDEAVRLNISQFLDQLAAFTTGSAHA